MFLLIDISRVALFALAAAHQSPDAAETIRLLDSGQPAEAARVLGPALVQSSADTLLLALKARVLWAQGQKTGAFTAAQAAEKTGLKDPSTQHHLALYYAQSGNRKRAAELESMYAVSPEADGAAPARAALLNFETGRLSQAISLGERALAIEDRAEIHLMLARAYERAARPDEAIRHYDALLAANPFDEETYASYGQALLRMGRFPKAISVLEEGQEKFDKSPQITLALGVAYYGQRRFAEAGGRFLRVIDLSPAVPQPYLFLSKMLDHLEPRMPDVVSRFEAWNRAETTSPFPPLVLGKALVLAGQAERAESLFRESIRRRDNLWESHFELGQAFDARGDLAGAAREYRRAIEISPKQPPPHYKLARVYVRQGLLKKAEAERQLHSRLVDEESHRGLSPEGVP